MECITRCHCISHLITLPPHFTLHHSTSSNTISDIPSHTTFQVTPSSVLTISHISYHNTSRSTLFHFAIPYRLQISPYRPHRLALHPIFTFLTDHITPRSMYSTPHFRSRDILATFMHRTTISSHHISHKTLHRISHAPQLASFHHSRSDREHIHRQFRIQLLTMFRIKFHITLYTTFYPPPLTSHLAQHRVSRPVTAHTRPHSTSHNVYIRAMPQHTYQSVLHHHFP